MIKLIKRITFISICLILNCLFYITDFGIGFIEEIIFGFFIITFAYLGIKNEGGN